MSTDLEREAGTIGPEVIPLGEVPMVRQERWEEIRRLRVEEGVPVAELARRFELDRKTVRRCLRDTAWRPYQRPARAAPLLAPHTEYLGERAPQVGYSAQILYQELRQRFRLEARQPRIVADDWLVSFETHRYSVPFTLIGQPVEILRRDGQVRIFHRGRVVAEHPELAGKYQVRILPEHGPGAIARTARRVRSTAGGDRLAARAALPEVEVRDLAIYETLMTIPWIRGGWRHRPPPRSSILSPLGDRRIRRMGATRPSLTESSQG